MVAAAAAAEDDDDTTDDADSDVVQRLRSRSVVDNSTTNSFRVQRLLTPPAFTHGASLTIFTIAAIFDEIQNKYKVSRKLNSNNANSAKCY